MAKKERVTCERCEREYDKGIPHMMFCSGNVPEGSECMECGEDEYLSECFDCGEVVCDICKEDGTHVC